MVIAADRKQARVVFRYISGLIENVPMLSTMVDHRTKESITLTNRVILEVHTANFRAIRGYTVVAAICDEIAFWRSEESANPDIEILNALRPGMATVPGAMLLCISSPHARRGALWEAYRRHFCQDGDPVLVWQADTLSMLSGKQTRFSSEECSKVYKREAMRKLRGSCRHQYVCKDCGKAARVGRPALP